MIVDLTAEKPLTRIICHHLHVDKCSREQTDSVSVVAFVRQDLAMEVCWVDVHLISHPKQMPVDLIAHTHSEIRQITVDITVNSYNTGKQLFYLDLHDSRRQNNMSVWGHYSEYEKPHD